jgi:hypothetical protein
VALVCGWSEGDSRKPSSVFPTVDKLGNLFQVKSEKVEKDEDQFLADSEVRMSVRYITTEAIYRGPYELDDDSARPLFVMARRAESREME